MRLERPSLKWKAEHEQYMQEWGNAQVIPSSCNLADYDTYEAFLKGLADRERGSGRWLPSTNYFLVNDEDRIVAMIDIRHELNEFLYHVGGHIGYSTRPSERQKGYATLILKEALVKCRQLGMNSVLVTCDEDNIGSAKVILKNGGEEDKPFTERDGTVKRRFWIHIGTARVDWK